MSVINLARELISCQSVTPEEGGALDLCQKYLEAAGFKCVRHIFSSSDSSSVDNLYARYGATAPNLCFGGHVDVVPVGDAAAWKHNPFDGVIDGEYLYGRGAEDMKAAIAAFISAAIDFVKSDFSGSVSLLLTADEEGDAVNGTRKMLEKITADGEKIDAAIIGEPTNPTRLGEMAKIGRRGSITGNITVHGMQGHVAYPHLADNPVSALVEILSKLKSTKLDDGNEFFQPSNLEVTNIVVGNSASNVIPAKASATFNVRFNNLHSSESIKNWVDKIATSHSQKYEISYRVTGESFLTPEGELSGIVSRAITAVTGITPDLSTTGGTSDARFFKNYCPVVEFGTTGATAHMVNERVRTADIELLQQIYSRILQGFFKL